MIMFRRLVLVTLIGCGGSKAPAKVPTPPPPPPPIACAPMVDHIFSLAADVPPNMLPKVKEATVKACDGDKWSEEAKACFRDTKTPDDGKACQQKLTEAQINSFATALVDVVKQFPDEMKAKE